MRKLIPWVLALLLFGLIMSRVLRAENEPVPQITAEQRAKFWRSEAEYLAAVQQVERAKAARDSAQAAMAKACGRPVVADASGEPICQPEPEQKPPK